MRYLILVFASIVIVSSCQKEVDPSILGNTTDSTNTCQLQKTIQGGDTILVYHYNSKGKLDLLIDSSLSIEPTHFQLYYDNQDRVIHFSQLDFAYFDVYFTYSGSKMISASYVDQSHPADSVIWTYQYGANTRPIRKNAYSVSNGQGRSLFEYTTYEYDKEENLTVIEFYWATGELQKTTMITYTDLPNYFKDLTIISEYINMLDFRNAIDPEIGWSNNAPYFLQIYDANRASLESRTLTYIPDSTKNTIKIISNIMSPTFQDLGDFTYDFYYKCK